MNGAVRSLKHHGPWFLVFGVLAWICGPALSAHVRRGFDPRVLADDARQQIYPFFRYVDSSLFPNDYIADYYIDCLPIGFRALYTMSAFLIDPTVMSKVVTYSMLLLTVVGMGVAANRLGGKVAAWGAMALVLGAEVYLDRIGGGLPRAFGFPVLVWAIVALAYGRVKWLAALTWVGAAFYPVAGLMSGMAMTFYLVLLPARDRGDASDWDLRKRLGVLALVAGISLVMLLPPALSSAKYGPVLTEDDVAAYPELGPGGRYIDNSRPPWKSFFERAPEAMRAGITGIGDPWVEPIFDWATEKRLKRRPKPRDGIVGFAVTFTIIGWLLFALSSSMARRVLILGLAAFVGYSIARGVAPYLYLPTRYTTYAMPLLAVLTVSTAGAGFFAMGEKVGWRSGRSSSLRAGVTLVFCLFILVTVGGRGSRAAGMKVDTRGATLYDEIAKLPTDALIAGWPSILRAGQRQMAIENVPYVSRRAALLTAETHQVFHQKYVHTMRKRMRAVIDATLATSVTPLVRLRDEHGVTHMLIYLPHLQGKGLRYFEPFNDWIERTKQQSADKPLVLQNLADNHAVYREGDYAIIDIRDLSGPS